MIQRPASDTFDLEFGVLAYAGQKSLAVTASEILQHRKPSHWRRFEVSCGRGIPKSPVAQAFQ
ncbi:MULTISPECIES: hypothetical protein [Pseudomonas]|uniref:hypothetical protein n=1 Tax=Pseudomonas TaxID=286 RepID=UPI002032F140|nr:MULTISPECIES: hypothetical protein [Pseudomonas]MCP1454490.1 hypothetical protein [Pseudomonas kilonensis]UVM64336.1 hypothetical protein LOY50_05730 [Pseudomonas sp. B21-010]WPN66414.1 hypothetical protein QMK48_05830 [Pseudomonas sp. P9_32]WPN71995.1 hypothetical protein QMK47_06735 [Pseudomonas sp. P9_35]